jgi:hypothetical protein
LTAIGQAPGARAFEPVKQLRRADELVDQEEQLLVGLTIRPSVLARADEVIQ